MIFILATFSSMYGFFVLVLPDQPRVSELLKVLVIAPKLEVITFSLEASDFIQDGKVSCTIFSAEFL